MSSSPSDTIEVSDPGGVTTATQSIQTEAKKANHIEIEKGQIDDREYHYLVLENQLKVLLISDPQADKAAASLDVHVGSSDDPVEREGLAHFLEHMLFLGTEKYPEAAAYQAFIDNNAGSHNAYTSAEHTKYFFDIDAEQLAFALDRFAQFFIAPLFDEAYVDRERNAVHSEYQAKIKDDSRRGYDVYRQQINPQHPYAKFSVGSVETLANRPNDKVRDDLIEFYQTHYSADQMTLVVLGKESISELQKIVVNRFVQIPLREIKKHVVEVPLFTSKHLPFEVISQPVKDTRNMSMVFPLPSVKAYYGEKPLSYIGFLLGHEGQGSVLSLLKSKGWAEGLSAGGGDAGAGNATFSVSVSLTKEGVKHRETIRAVVFHALDIIKQNGIEEWRYIEEQRMADIAFQFREKGRAMSTVSRLADSLHEYPAAEVISANYRYTRFDAELIQQLLSKMTPKNLFVSTVFPEVETDQITEKYQVPYIVMPLSVDRMSLPVELTQNYALPNKNIFIPTDAQLFENNKELSVPKKIALGANDSVNTNSTLWVRQDVSINVPKVNAFVRVQSPLVASSPRYAALNQLLIDMINDQLNENSYPASLAGLSYSLSPNSRGFDIGLQGYNNKMPVLLSMLSAQIQQPILSADRFAQLKIELIRQLKNSQQQTPYKQLFGQLPVSLFTPYYSGKNIIAELESITQQELSLFASRWLKGAQIKGLVYGNVNSEAESLWASTLNEWMQKGDQALTPARVAKLPIANSRAVNSSGAKANSLLALEKRISQVSLNVDHGDTAVGLYVQGTNDSLSDQANMVLLRQVLDSAFYSQLRTEQQLGYIVFLTSMTIKEVPGSFFVVQSPSASVVEIKQAVVTFLNQSEDLISDDLSGLKRSVSTKLLETPQTLSAKASRYWQNVLKSNDDFDYRERLVQQVNGISPQQLRAYYKKTLLNQDHLLWLVANNEVQDVDVALGDAQTYYRYP
jgi:secreted Zn-dependent insulinase-like peptidase